MKYITLNNGVKMPQLGLGVFQIEDFDTAKKTVLTGLKNGYRLIDTATAYKNESAVGEAIKESDIRREDIFVTSKLWVQDMTYDGAKRGFQSSLDKLGLDYIDLYLLHLPIGDIFGAWHALEELYETGKIRAIGVSNFEPSRLVDFIHFNKVIPAVNQIKLNIFNQQTEIREFMHDYDIKLEAWGPFDEGKHNIFKDLLLTKIGEKYQKSAAQVALRWIIEQNAIAIPKSTHEERLVQNMDIFDFSLTDEDLKEISTFNIDNSRLGYHDPEEVSRILDLEFH
ncbi:aldo/keto reductase [Companilactobacillus keshanensis]|uniref:Aldo/keto reductase n=1 Tax=Companilactobacillus keshanensis TaxID=2486003 RepID=A0ABW4BXB1_9LACO|nr:aldo/keto reductase [Companilactobacillus keshanensis]